MTALTTSSTRRSKSMVAQLLPQKMSWMWTLSRTFPPPSLKMVPGPASPPEPPAAGAASRGLACRAETMPNAAELSVLSPQRLSDAKARSEFAFLDSKRT